MPSRVDQQFWMKLAAEKAEIEAAIKNAKQGEVNEQTKDV